MFHLLNWLFAKGKWLRIVIENKSGASQGASNEVLPRKALCPVPCSRINIQRLGGISFGLQSSRISKRIHSVAKGNEARLRIEIENAAKDVLEENLRRLDSITEKDLKRHFSNLSPVNSILEDLDSLEGEVSNLKQTIARKAMTGDDNSREKKLLDVKSNSLNTAIEKIKCIEDQLEICHEIAASVRERIATSEEQGREVYEYINRILEKCGEWYSIQNMNGAYRRLKELVPQISEGKNNLHQHFIDFIEEKHGIGMVMTKYDKKYLKWRDG
jgi:vacuolar-type H+-ATPase subunit I/STV1